MSEEPAFDTDIEDAVGEPTGDALSDEVFTQILAAAKARTEAHLPHKVTKLEADVDNLTGLFNTTVDTLADIAARVNELGAKFCFDTSPAFEEWLGQWAETYYQADHIMDLFMPVTSAPSPPVHQSGDVDETGTWTPDETRTNSALFAELHSLWAYWLQAFGSPVSGEAQVRWHESHYHFLRERLPYWIEEAANAERRRDSPTAYEMLKPRIDAARERAAQQAGEENQNVAGSVSEDSWWDLDDADQAPYLDNVEELVEGV